MTPLRRRKQLTSRGELAPLPPGDFSGESSSGMLCASAQRRLCIEPIRDGGVNLLDERKHTRQPLFSIVLINWYLSFFFFFGEEVVVFSTYENEKWLKSSFC